MALSTNTKIGLGVGGGAVVAGIGGYFYGRRSMRNEIVDGLLTVANRIAANNAAASHSAGPILSGRRSGARW